MCTKRFNLEYIQNLNGMIKVLQYNQITINFFIVLNYAFGIQLSLN